MIILGRLAFWRLAFWRFGVLAPKVLKTLVAGKRAFSEHRVALLERSVLKNTAFLERSFVFLGARSKKRYRRS